MWIMLNGRVKGFENSHLQQQSLLIILCSNDNRGKLCSCTYQHPASEFLNWCSYRIFAINRRFSEYVDGKVLHYSWVWLMAMKNAKPKHEKNIYICFCSSLIDVWERKGKKWALTWNYLNKYSPKSKYYLE